MEKEMESEKMNKKLLILKKYLKAKKMEKEKNMILKED